ncbi:MAG: phosphohydrolase [Comamonadaceae bacterium CG12_big_fil_rev_8_21_14_0_65_59_15]|nr:MAG: phosphohydrolase [Comamonadaceae bacterium CG12_big_fil_rev_8_21_14_0_65_59_15]
MRRVKVLRLPRSKVHLGAPLPWNVRDEQGQLLLSKGHLIVNERQLDELLERGAFVDVEEIRAAASNDAPKQEQKIVAPPNLFGLWEKKAQALRDLCQHPKAHADFLPQLEAYSNHLLMLLDRHVDVGIYRCVRQENQPHYYYGYNHAIHTAVMCVLLARHLQWSATRVLSLVRAALTMNLSIMELQGQMAAQDTPIKDAQKKDILAHPQAAVALLESLGVTDTDWLTAVVQHHEHLDGSGYPTGCTQPSDMATALRVTDVFMAKISPRALREALTSQEAIRQLYREDQGGPMSTAIVKQFGIYPPGDYVELATGERGIVVERTDNARASIVAVITDATGRLVTKTERRDSSQPGCSIVGNVVDKVLLKRLPPERFYGFVALDGERGDR